MNIKVQRAMWDMQAHQARDFLEANVPCVWPEAHVLMRIIAEESEQKVRDIDAGMMPSHE